LLVYILYNLNYTNLKMAISSHTKSERIDNKELEMSKKKSIFTFLHTSHLHFRLEDK